MVSVIIPVYNRRELVLQAVSSVLGQSWGDLEIILADDGSTDGLDEAVIPYCRDHRLRYIPLEHHGYPGAVRNRGAEHARGDWIAFLDSDDLWLPEKLQHQMELSMTRPELQCIHCTEIWLRGEQVISQRTQRHRREGYLFSDSLKKCIIGPSTVIIRRNLYELLDGFREDMVVAEDYELWLRLTAREEVGYVHQPLVVKRAGYGGDQLSERYGQIEVFRIQGLLDLLNTGWLKERPGKREEACRELARKCLIYAGGARKRGHEQEAGHYESIAREFSAASS